MAVAVSARPRPDARWIAFAAAPLAAALGATAVVSPVAAVGAVLALLFVAIAFYDLALGVAILATVMFFKTLPVATGASLGAIKVGGLVLVLAALRRSGTPLLLREHPLVAYAATFLAAWALASSFWAYDVPQAAGYGLRLTLNVALLFVIFAAIRHARSARWVVSGYLLGAAAAALVGLVQGPQGDEERLAGSVGDPNFLAAMLVPAIVFAVFAFGWTRHPAERWLLCLLLVLFTVALLETQSRGGLVALVVTLAAGMVFGGRFRRHFAAVCAAIAFVGLAYFAAFATAEAVGRITNPGGGAGRSDLWAVAAEVVSDHPLVGVGAGNFPIVAPQYVTGTLDLPEVQLVVDQPTVAHNTYIGVLAELGVVGLIAFAVVVLGRIRARPPSGEGVRTCTRSGARAPEPGRAHQPGGNADGLLLPVGPAREPAVAAARPRCRPERHRRATATRRRAAARVSGGRVAVASEPEREDEERPQLAAVVLAPGRVVVEEACDDLRREEALPPQVLCREDVAREHLEVGPEPGSERNGEPALGAAEDRPGQERLGRPP